MADDTLIAAVAGVIGIAIGAWLNAIHTTRRERWNLKRELYTRLLENLAEAKEALPNLMQVIESPTEPGIPDEEIDPHHSEWERKVGLLNDQVFGALNRVRQATSVAAILLSDEALNALEQLQKERIVARRQTHHLKYLSDELWAVKTSYNLIVKAARQDLGVKQNWKSWLGARIYGRWTRMRSVWERSKRCDGRK